MRSTNFLMYYLVMTYSEDLRSVIVAFVEIGQA